MVILCFWSCTRVMMVICSHWNHHLTLTVFHAGSSSWDTSETSFRWCSRSSNRNLEKMNRKEERRSWWRVWEPDTATSIKPSNKDLSVSLGLKILTECFCILQWNDGIPIFFHKEVSAERCFCTTLRGVFVLHNAFSDGGASNKCMCRFFADLCISQVFDILESFCISAPLTRTSLHPTEVLSFFIPQSHSVHQTTTTGIYIKHSLTKHTTTVKDLMKSEREL